MMTQPLQRDLKLLAPMLDTLYRDKFDDMSKSKTDFFKQLHIWLEQLKSQESKAWKRNISWLSNSFVIWVIVSISGLFLVFKIIENSEINAK